ncbi:MAG: hypothetical protein M3362_00565 [Acidobacteriota bacterium]|nr:hypothetical protein [Acidobacteriota bacterium]
MNQEDAIEQLLLSFPKVYYYSIRHLPREYVAATTVGTNKAGTMVEIGILHFSTLWLIEMLTNGDTTKYCVRTDIERIFLWKYPGKKNTFDETVMNKLVATGLVEQKEREGYRQGKEVRLTELATELLRDLREGRRNTLTAILSFLNIELGENYEEQIRRFNQYADSLWECILTEASVSTESNSLTIGDDKAEEAD